MQGFARPAYPSTSASSAGAGATRPSPSSLDGILSPSTSFRQFTDYSSNAGISNSANVASGSGSAGAGASGGSGSRKTEQRFGSEFELEDKYGRQTSHDSGQGRGQAQQRSETNGSGNANASWGYAGSGGGTTGKRGSKACVACRKGKNRCEGDPNSDAPCKRCAANNIECVYEKPSDRSGRARGGSVGEGGGPAEERVQVLESSVKKLAQGQNQIQAALQQILSMLPGGQHSSVTPTSTTSIAHDGGIATGAIFSNPTAHSPFYVPDILKQQQPDDSPSNLASGRSTGGDTRLSEPKQWPKLPGFAPPNHRFGTYGVIPLPSAPGSPNAHSRRSSTSSSHSVASSGALAADSLTAPIQALQALANAADQAAANASSATGSVPAGSDDPASRHLGDKAKRKRVALDEKTIELRVKKKRKPDPTPRNPFPDVVTKGLVAEHEARELWDIFFTGCHFFVPLWDKAYDKYESFMERTPFSMNSLLAVAAKIRAGNGPLGHTFHRCLEEAQGIARSTLFGPIVRKEAVMAMLILSVWSQNGWLPTGHAVRAALDMNLHRALDKLADSPEPRSEMEERDLVVSGRIWLNCYVHDHLCSLGTGKPLMLRDDLSVRRARILLTHPMGSETDMRLIAGVELVNLRIEVQEHLGPLHGAVTTSTISFVKRMFTKLQDWYDDWNRIHLKKYDAEHVLVKLLEAELVYAQMWTVCVALRGVQWDKLPPDQRELALQAKDAAWNCLDIFLRSAVFRSHLKFATHDQLVSAAFAAVFLLKIAVIFPSAMSLPKLIANVAELAHVLSTECFAERYALTLRLMLSNFRRKTGALSTVPGTPRFPASFSGIQSHNGTGSAGGAGALDPSAAFAGELDDLLSLPQMGFEGFEGLGEVDNGFEWPMEFSPSDLPVWLQDNNFTDLGLPADGSDSLFLPPELANMFLPSGTTSGTAQFFLPDSGDAGAEAW